MSEQENKQDTTQDNESNLADLEPIDEVKGGSIHNTGALLNLANTNTYQGTTTVNERESVKLSGLAAGTYL